MQEKEEPFGQAVTEDRNHRGEELSLVVGPWNKGPGAHGDSPGPVFLKGNRAG